MGDKVFIEMYWLNTDTGFTGESSYASRICVTSEEAESEGYVKRNKITEDDLKPDSHVSACDVDFSTGIITDRTTGKTYQAAPFPPFIEGIIKSGGLLNSLKERGAAK